MENYIMLNGKRIDLTAEQIETLVGKKEKDPFERVEGGKYSYIDSDGKVETEYDDGVLTDGARYEAGNYCADRELLEQRVLHEILNRLLWRYSMQHGGRKNDWGDDCDAKCLIGFAHSREQYYVEESLYGQNLGCVYFQDAGTANAAIEEIVKPFMEKHPEFRW